MAVLFGNAGIFYNVDMNFQNQPILCKISFAVHFIDSAKGFALLSRRLHVPLGTYFFLVLCHTDVKNRQSILIDKGPSQ